MAGSTMRAASRSGNVPRHRRRSSALRPCSAWGASTEPVLLPNNPCRKSTRFSLRGAGEVSSSASHHRRTSSTAARTPGACRSSVASKSSSVAPANRSPGLLQMPRAASGRSGWGVSPAARTSTRSASSADRPRTAASSAGVAAKARRRSRCRRSATASAPPVAGLCLRVMNPPRCSRCRPPATQVRNERRGDSASREKQSAAAAQEHRAPSTEHSARRAARVLTDS